MARPTKEGMDYFPHDVDASNDEKLELLTSIYGNDGYAFYFIMLERIYRNKNFLINISDEETKKGLFNVLSKKMRLENEKFEQILISALKFGLFDGKLYYEKNILTSDGIKKRSKLVIDKRVSMKKWYEEKKKVSATETNTKTNKEITTETKQKSCISGHKEKERQSKDKDKEKTKTKKSKDKEKTNNKEKGLKDVVVEVINILENKVKYEEAKVIALESKGNLEVIRNVYEYSKTQDIKNLVGFMKELVKPGAFNKKIEQSKLSGFNNFEARAYDYDKLEKKLLGWD